jgi:putative ABC transport system permease protein
MQKKPTFDFMFRNFILAAYRNLLRNKIFSLINISGLAIGMAACILIAQYIVFEKSYDTFHQNYSNLYRVVNVRHYPTHTDESAGCVTALGPALKETFPEVVDFARCYKSDRVFTFNENSVHFTRVFSVDSTFLKIFTFPVTKGPTTGFLARPNTAVLTEAASKTLFGNEDPIGKTFFQGKTPYVVEAVVANVPENSHIKFDLLLSLVTDLIDPNYCITCNNRNTYIRLSSEANPLELQSKMESIVKEMHPDGNIKREYELQPLSSIHLNSHLRMEHEQNGNAKSVMALTLVAALILFMAWLNYINLSTSMAIKRSSEVGIRRVNGSTKTDLVFQFLIEAFLVNTIALGVSIFLSQLVFPVFTALTSITTSFTLLTDATFWLVLGALLIVGSVVYGFYPAFIVSSFKPIQALKGKTSLPKGVYSLRLSLVFLQFLFSVVLISGTLAMYSQIFYMKAMDLGMHINQTLVVPIPNDYRDSDGSDAFGTELMQHSSINEITYSSTIPGQEAGNVGGGYKLENAPSESSLQLYSFYVNKNYFDFLSIDFLAGKGPLSDQLNNDRNAEIIINDAARKAFGFNSPEDALGKIIYHDADIVGKIQGVVKDHHNRSLDNPIAPTFFQYTKGKGFYLIKTAEASVKENIALVQKSFEKHYPNNPFEYYFLDEYFNKQYNEHIQFGKVFALFTALAIFIACLGLSGLSMYVIKIRTKEIALRKVLGATVSTLLLMLSKEYVKLTVVAFVLATPIAYYLIDQWLQTFSYHIEIAWWMFVIPGVMVLAITLLTVSAQSLKTALSKPTESLRTE